MQHLAIIPDGNRRWALQHKLESFLGHKKGMETVRTAIKVAIKNGIKYLSFYTFSIENFRRGDFEKNYLFSLLATNIPNEIPELVSNGIRVRFIGDRSLFPENVRDSITKVEEQTKHLTTLNLNLLFCYGGTAELTEAVRVIAQKVKDGVLHVNDITQDTIREALWTAGIPDPDLIIRTGKISRLSNFLLFQSAYSEYSFLDCYWPEITESHIEQCIERFKQTKRNFGR